MHDHGIADGGVGERIGVFGGTFDPPHVEHLFAAIEVRAELGLDRVLFVVANRPWQKVGTRPITPAEVRFEMVRAAVADFDGLEASDLEIRRGGDSFTVDTLAELHAARPGAELFVIVGADVEALVPTWKSVDRVREAATLVVVSRDGHGAEDGPEDDAAGWRSVERVPIPRLDVSGTELRERVAAGRPIDVLCQPDVIRIIGSHGLYRVENP